MLQGKSITSTRKILPVINRRKNIIIDVNYTQIKFTNNQSKRMPEFEFVNFLSQDAFTKKQALQSIVEKLKINDFSLLKTEEITSIDPNAHNRVLAIIHNSGALKVFGIHEVKKSKYKDDPSIQFLFRTNSKNELELLLVDLWHLCYPSDLYKNGKAVKYNRKSIYERHAKSGHNQCISNIVK